MEKVNINIKEQANEILRIAQKFGVEQNFLFLTTFKRYQVQLNILNELEQKIKEDGALVTKEYVKGRENVYTHPAIGEYNKTATSANQTVATLIKIIKSLRNDDEEENEGEDALLSALGIR
nr:MAG TPA: terminase small subunit [Caudoviricetes sp.]